MKKQILMWAAALTLVMVSCKENPYMPSPGATEQVPDSVPELKYPDPTPAPDTIDIPDGAITVYEARKIARRLSSGESTAKKYYVMGWVCSLDDAHASGVTSYGNGTFSIAATNDGKTDRFPFIAYQVYGSGGRKLTAADQVAAGDFVVIYGKIMNYSGTAETEGKGAAQIYASSNPKFNAAFPPIVTIHATCAEAKAAALALPGNNVPSNEIYVVEGYVQSEGYNATVSRGQQIFWIADTPTGGKVFEAYYCNVPNGQAVQIGQKVRLTGNIMKYNTTAEMKNGDVEVIE